MTGRRSLVGGLLLAMLAVLLMTPAAQALAVGEKAPDFALPNAPGGTLITTYPSPQNNRSFITRVDYNLGRNTIDGHYNYNLATQSSYTGDVPTYLPVSNRALSQHGTIGDTWAVRPSLLNQVRLSYNRFTASIDSCCAAVSPKANLDLSESCSPDAVRASKLKLAGMRWLLSAPVSRLRFSRLRPA